MVGPVTLSWVVAGVVSTWVMRSGWPSSQVSLMALIAHPMGVAFTTLARLYIVGLLDEQRGGRLLVHGAPADVFQARDRTAVILLEPNLPQGLQGGEVAEGGRVVCGPHPIQELIAIHPNLACEGVAFARVFRQA